MLVLGIVVGPAFGLALGQIFTRFPRWRGWPGVGVTAILALVIAVLPAGDVGLRLGFDAGLILGVLLWFTPVPAYRDEVILPSRERVTGPRAGSPSTGEL